MEKIRRQYHVAFILLTAVCLVDFFTETLEVLVGHTGTLAQLAAAGIFWDDGAPLLAELTYHMTVPLGHALLAATAWRGYKGKSLTPLWEIACGVCTFHWLWLLITHCLAATDGVDVMWHVDVYYAVLMVAFWVLYGLSARAVPALMHNRRLLEYVGILFKSVISVMSLVVMVELGATGTALYVDWLLHLLITGGLCAGLLLLGAEHE